MIFVGFDPGKTGAMAALTEQGELFEYERFPLLKDGKKSELDIPGIAAWLADRVAGCGGKMVVTIEKVHAMPGQGVTSMFSFGRSLGIIEGIVVTHGCPRIYAPPRTWQAMLLEGKERGKASKHSAAVAAVELWPELSKIMQVKANWPIADAALIAEFGRRRWSGGNG
jgi:crossover junction endodeoxyribonuclease RuvC